MNIRTRVLLAVALVGLISAATAQAAFTDVTGFDGGGWKVDYQYHVVDQTLNGNNTFYDTNNAAAINAAGNAITRVAYYMELSGSADNSVNRNGFVFVSFDTIHADAAKLGIPTTQSGEFYQQNVTNMHIVSNVAGVETGTGLAGGNIEFWPSNYGQNLDGSSPANADNDLFDFGDNGSNTSSGFGSMQIHNHALTAADIYTGRTGQTVFAFNQWGGTAGNDLGIGNQSGPYNVGSVNPDWTFHSNRGAYTVADIQVLVQTVPEPATLSLLAMGAIGLVVGRIARRRAA